MMSDAARTVLARALADPGVRARYEAKVAHPPERSCHYWIGALHARTGHGRFFIGKTPAGHDVCVIAHRFGWGLRHGLDALLEVPVLAHRCDEPSCQNPDHLIASTWGDNLEQFHRRHWLPNSPLHDTRGPAGRARAIRTALRQGHDLEATLDAGRDTLDTHQLVLW